MQRNLKKRIKGEEIFFTDKIKIQIVGYTNDYIRLTEENEEKLKKVDENILNFMRREKKKFEKSLIFVGEVLFWVGKSVIVEGTVNEFLMHRSCLFIRKIMKN